MVLGIDLGTTYSAGAYLDAEGRPHVIDNSEGKALTPSVVLFDTEERATVGEIAKDSIIIRQEDVISTVKNYMGKKVILKEVGGVQYTPEMISSLIIKKVVKDAERAVGEKVSGVVITVPAYFDDAQRKATEDAAVMAGVPMVGMINEPTAAALWYAYKNDSENERLLVYDLGGGTFDVTILEIRKKDDIEVKSTGGLSGTGGRFFDQLIVDYVRDYMEEKYEIDLEEDDYVDELQELYIKAENAKIQLSNNMACNINLKIGKIKEQIEITREMFERKIAPFYARTERKVKEAIKAAGLQIQDIDKVLLVGGSCRIPYIEQCVTQYMGKEPSREVNPDEAVAIGAALYADICVKNDAKRQFTDVCSHSIGVVVLNDFGVEENEIIIPKNSTIPVSSKQSFRTAVENQKLIRVTITEGEYKELTDISIVGSFDVELPSGLRKQAQILLSISLDDRQLLHIHVELPEINFAKEQYMKRVANMDEESIASATGMIRDIQVS